MVKYNYIILAMDLCIFNQLLVFILLARQGYPFGNRFVFAVNDTIPFLMIQVLYKNNKSFVCDQNGILVCFFWIIIIE